MKAVVACLLLAVGCERAREPEPVLPDEPIRAVPAPPVELVLDHERMFRDLERLAADDMAGRFSGDPDAIRAAANFISKAHREAGLAPVGGKYLAEFTMAVGREAAPSHHLWIEHDGESTPADDNAFLSVAFGEQLVDLGPAVFVGKKPTVDGVRDAVAVMLAGPQWSAEELKARLQVLRGAGATAVLVVAEPDEELPRALREDLEGLSLTTVFIKRSVADVLTIGGKSFAQAAKTPPKKTKPVDKTTISLARRTRPVLAEVPNVLATIAGDDLADEIVVLGAHYDHIGTEQRGAFCRDPPSTDDPEDAICNGADDNASGTAMVLAVARAIATSGYRPRRSLVFAHFAGEELGLHGSRELVDHPPRAPPFAGGTMVAMVNLDMVGRLGSRGLEIGGTGTSDAWEPLLQRLRPAGLDVSFTRSVNSRSDHANFHRNGVPVLFFFTGLHADYHRTSDEADLLNREGMIAIGSLVLEVTRALGDGESLLSRQAARGRTRTRASRSRASRGPSGSSG